MIRKLLRPTYTKRFIFFVLSDVVLFTVSLLMAYKLRMSFDLSENHFNSFYLVLFLVILLKVGLSYFFKLYSVSWRFFSLVEGKKLLLMHLIAYAIIAIIYYGLPSFFNPFSRSVLVIDFFLSLGFVMFLRFSKRMLVEKNRDLKNPTLLIGVNNQTALIIKSFLNKDIDTYPVVIIDDTRAETYFLGVPVAKESEMLALVDKYKIVTVVFTEETEQKELERIVVSLNEVGVHQIKRTQIFSDNTKPLFKDVSIEDLLARKPKGLDMISIANFIAGKVVMITGAGGSIGSELAQQVETFGASQIILIDNSEFNLYSINEEIKSNKHIAIMQNIKENSLLERTFSKYTPDIVLHAAAYKHVPLCESNIQEAINNNIFGTKNVIDLSIKYEVSKVVLISTDKAVRPTNVMGATKRVCELYAHAVPCKETEIVAVRFGNVLGSSGSVIPKFKEQIQRGENITVTHPDITRYFMMIPEACQLVLQAASIAKGGELFILDMGAPIKIVDLAQKMIDLSGRHDIQIVFSGLRPGEKLYEELLIEDSDLKTVYSSIMVAKNAYVDFEKLSSKIKRLKEETPFNKLDMLKEIVPEFNHLP